MSSAESDDDHSCDEQPEAQAVASSPAVAPNPEWTDSIGHAVINILIGCKGKIYVVASEQLDCKGPNLGVEHSELERKIVDALELLGIQLKDV